MKYASRTPWHVNRKLQRELSGQKDVIRQVMLALLAGGNVLLEGMPGLGKTMLVRTISQVCDLSFQRTSLPRI